MAFESDNGPFRPRGVGFTGSDAARAILQRVVPLLAPLAADTVFPQGDEADIGPLIEQGVPGMSLLTVGERYFWYHHSQGDTLDKVDPAELARCVAVMAIMAYVVADLPEPLPR
jgi:carboxypeptidase Q